MTQLHSKASDTAALRNVTLFMDVSPLMELAWTGIARVTASLACELFRRFPRNSHFFVRDRIIDPEALLIACEKSPGGYLEVLLSYGYADLGHISDYIGRGPCSVGIFPNIKTAHRVFDIEIAVLHDLSAMLMPELHELWAADLYTQAMSRDVQSSDLVCCVSEATRQDALRYLDLEASKSFVSYLGVHRPALLDEPAPPRRDFVLVLGTIEPRKNLRLVAEFLLSRPDLADEMAFIFVGRRGWGAGFDHIFGELLQEQPWKDRIVFTDFLPEADKWALMRSAHFAIFPSLFEGFGLPVLECMAAGCPVIASRSSSLVEFNLPQQMYFDPFSVTDFSHAFRFVNSLSELDRASLGETLQFQSRKFTWDACFNRIIKALADRLSAPAQPSPRTGNAPAKSAKRRREADTALN